MPVWRRRLRLAPIRGAINLIAAEARVGAVVGSLGIEGEVWGGRLGYTFSNGTSTTASYAGLGMHVNHRWNDGLVGGLVSFGISPNGYNATFLNTALEAQKDFGRLTLVGQAGYTQTLSTSGVAPYSLAGPVGWYAHGIARWFSNDDLMFAGDIGYAGFSDSNGETGDVWRWGARVEHRLSSAPVSAFVAYQGFRWRQSSMMATTHVIMGGLTLIVGDPTLMERYRGPADLDDRNPFYGVNNPY